MTYDQKVYIGATRSGETFYLDRNTGKVWQYGGDIDNVYASMDDIPAYAKEDIASYLRKTGLVLSGFITPEEKQLGKDYRREKAEEAKRLDDFESVFEYGTSKKSIRAHPTYGLKSNRGQGGYFKHRREHSVNARKSRRRR